MLTSAVSNIPNSALAALISFIGSQWPMERLESLQLTNLFIFIFYLKTLQCKQQ